MFSISSAESTKLHTFHSMFCIESVQFHFSDDSRMFVHIKRFNGVEFEEYRFVNRGTFGPIKCTRKCVAGNYHP